MAAAWRQSFRDGAEHAGSPLFQSMSTPAPSSTGRLVVVVDACAPIRHALRRSLPAAGYDVKTVATAGELLDGELPARLTAALIDIHLPDLDGLALMQQLRARHAGLPVVIITAEDDPQL